MTNITEYVVIGTILGVGVIILLLGWRVIREFKKGASRDDEYE
ncbi:MAG: hypothetical protein SV760_07585 [Halobacteria archaeon]|nr:hypothetical protein [Halobacteria archaeon]